MEHTSKDDDGVTDGIDFSSLEDLLNETLLIHRHRLSRDLAALQRAVREGRPFDRSLGRLEAALEQSQNLWRQRRDSRPEIHYDENLPVCARRHELADAISRHQVVVVCGETGSGKSTQLPKICLELGLGVAGMIGHTQPRRLAARSIAARLAEELKTSVGQQVGYKVRFQDETQPRTLIKLMTDGILLAETQHDRWLNRYGTLIIDEAHERSLNIDFLLGYLHRLVRRRPELRVIITSATIDAERFAEHFRDAVGETPILEVSGRSYPVDILYRSPRSDEDDVDTFQAIAEAIDDLQQHGPGDVLVFLPTERDIHEAMKTLRGRSFRGQRPELLPLYARLGSNEQQRVFHPGGNWRVILATNVAESSLTVPGIRYVVDTGTVRLSRYSPRSRLQRLPIEGVSKASANQRAGRCGRTGPGICIRLYDQADFAHRDAFTAPEIVRSNLASVILQTEHLGLGRIQDFPFLDPPKSDAIREGYQTLFELGAVDAENKLTDLGRTLSRIPVDPRIGRIVLAGHAEGCLTEMLIIAAGLEVQDPRERPFEHREAADTAHEKFADSSSDFLSLLKLWDFYHHLKDTVSRSQLQKSCRQNFLSLVRLREWADICRELHDVARQFDMRPTDRKNDPAAIHRALLTGFLSGLAMRTESGEYLVAGGQKAWLWPGSGLADQKPQWIVSAELVETTRRFVRTVARIDPKTIEPLALHLLNATYTEPAWDAADRTAYHFERVSLMGLPIIPRRRKRLAGHDPRKSREMLLWNGLVAGEYENPPEFLAANWKLAASLRELLQRARRPGYLRDDDEVFDFYNRRIPDSIVDGRQLEAWYKKATAEERQALHMQESDLLVIDSAQLDIDRFPESLEQNGMSLKLSYALDPGTEQDGVTLEVPQEALNQIDEDRLEWLVPGLLGEKVTSLLKTLPKDSRRMLVPLPDAADQIAQGLAFGQGKLINGIIEQASLQYRVQLIPAEFDRQRVPLHLRMQIRVVDGEGETLATSRDLQELRRRFGGQAAALFSATSESHWRRDGLTDWNFGDLPETVNVRRGDLILRGYPGLVDVKTSVSLRLFDEPARALAETRLGLRRLFCLQARTALSRHVSFHPQRQRWKQQAAAFPQPLDVDDEFATLLAERAFLKTTPWPRNQTAFRERLEDGLENLTEAAQDVGGLLGRIFDAAAELRRDLKEAGPANWGDVRADLQSQYQVLLASGFLGHAPFGWLSQYPRYLQAMSSRWRKLRGGGLARDLKGLAIIQPRWIRGIQRRNDHRSRGVYDPELELYLWMIEELRVTIFAQELGSAIPISEKRVDSQWEKVRP